MIADLPRRCGGAFSIRRRLRFTQQGRATTSRMNSSPNRPFTATFSANAPPRDSAEIMKIHWKSRRGQPRATLCPSLRPGYGDKRPGALIGKPIPPWRQALPSRTIVSVSAPQRNPSYNRSPFFSRFQRSLRLHANGPSNMVDCRACAPGHRVAGFILCKSDGPTVQVPFSISSVCDSGALLNWS